MKPENAFKKRLVETARSMGAMVLVIETTTGRGVPDLWINGRWVEVKYQTTKLRKEQWALHMEMKEKTGTVPLIVIANRDGTISASFVDVSKPMETVEIHRYAKIADLCDSRLL